MADPDINFHEAQSLITELSDEYSVACVGGTGYNWKDQPAYYDSASGQYYVYDKKGNVKYLKEKEADKVTFNPDGSYRFYSDRQMKENFLPVDQQEILTQIAKLPIQTWNYKHQPQCRHIGPMAQDFTSAFGVGDSDQQIHPVDANGVTLAAIQALYKLLQEKDAQIAALRADLAALQQRIQVSR